MRAFSVLLLPVFLGACDLTNPWEETSATVIAVRIERGVVTRPGDSGMVGAILGTIIAGAPGAVIGGLATRKSDQVAERPIACTVSLGMNGSVWLASAPTWAINKCATLRSNDVIAVERHRSGSLLFVWGTRAHYQGKRDLTVRPAGT